MKGGQGKRGLKHTGAEVKGRPEPEILWDQAISIGHLTFSTFFPALGDGTGEGMREGGGDGEGDGAVGGERHGWSTAGDGERQEFSIGGEEGFSIVGEGERHGLSIGVDGVSGGEGERQGLSIGEEARLGMGATSFGH
jgi:hypothetical protein